MFKRLILTILPLAIIITIPIMLRKPAETIDREADQLVIISAHNESLRYEIEQAFRKHYQNLTGRKVNIDWRSIGGTSEIVRYINASVTAAFKDHWVNKLEREWTAEVERDFLNPRLKPEDNEARKTYLESNIGIGIDLFFGGGQYDANKQANFGTVVPCGLRERHPELFTGKNPVLVQGRGGETWYDKNDRYYGTCFSSFGICMNLDRLAALGYDVTDPVKNPPIKTWGDLADKRLLGAIGLADPTKSGSINKCFEMLVQWKMAKSMTAMADRINSGKLKEQDALNMAWQDSMALIKQIGGNSRYMTFSASKVPVDCAGAQIAAGMCIDFYGRSQALWEEEHVGRKTMIYVTPIAGSSSSADPISMFRGAPNRERAQMFIDFVMSIEGQRLWNQKVGTPGGPIKYALNRLPIRSDLYTQEDRKHMISPEADPLKAASDFTYHPAWTAPLFDLLRNTIRVMLIDSEQELKTAWNAILKAGGPEKCPEAFKVFSALPFTHAEAREQARRLNAPESQAVAIREWAGFFREHYTRAAELAEQGR